VHYDKNKAKKKKEQWLPNQGFQTQELFFLHLLWYGELSAFIQKRQQIVTFSSQIRVNNSRKRTKIQLNDKYEITLFSQSKKMFFLENSITFFLNVILILAKKY